MGLVVALSACGGGRTQTLPTLAVLPSPTLTPKATGNESIVIPVSTSEQQSPPEVVTVEAAFVILTPTAPPSKTPTQTETPTQTPTVTPTPTEPMTATATATALIPPTKIVEFLTPPPITAVVAKPIDRVCDSEWFFIKPRPESCPLTEATVSPAVYQPFEHGFMVWIEQEALIYVLYNTFEQPAWETFEDTYQEGMPETDGSLEAPYDGVFQPRRGFGNLWRSEARVRGRIGWALQSWEVPYSSDIQFSEEGTLFLKDPDGGVIALFADQRDWQRYIGNGESTRVLEDQE